MKAYCELCGRHEASFRPGNDSKTGKAFIDLCCDGCNCVLATLGELEGSALDPAPPAAKAVEMEAGDTKRLDWLQANCTGASNSERYLPFRIWWGKPHAGNNKTLRSAIDAAMGGNHG